MTETLAKALALQDHEMVCVVGGGGKTTMVFSLAAEAQALGHPAAVTTTTKMGAEETGGLLTVEGSEPLPDGLVLRWVGEVQGHRVVGRTPEEIDACFAERVGWMLVEADGSRRHPVKAPAAHEPVIPQAATVVVLSMGLDALGKSLAEAAHRPEVAAALLGVSQEATVTPELLAILATDAFGGRKCLPPEARFVVALTKMTEERRAEAGRLAGLLLAAEGAPERVLLVPPPGGMVEVRQG
ncbi:MAG: selenium cofactor biosynthesis protein YqeC [Acidimicrobiales bacterium]|nr:selenium cofactor biosynthesis protein YqeC [Acidimicrobiales bacterium]